MATYTKYPLSASISTEGLVNISLSSTSGTLIHETYVDYDLPVEAVMEEVWLYLTNLSNTNTTVCDITLGTSSPFRVTLPPQSGPILVLPGIIMISTDGSPVTPARIEVDAVSGGDVQASGYVNRISP
jgi:hypothetical protein